MKIPTFAFSLSLLALSAAGHAQKSVWVDASTASTSDSPGKVSGPGPYTKYASSSNGAASASAHGTAADGMLKAYAHAYGSGDDLPNNSATAFARVSIVDTMTFTPDDPTLLGTEGVFYGSVFVDGHASRTGISAAHLTGSARIGEYGSEGEVNGATFSFDADSGPVDTHGYIPFAATFTWGQTVGLVLELDAWASGREGGSGTVDFAHSLYWGGITNVTSTKGDLGLNGFALTSGSNFDYTQNVTPVPEPASFAALAVGAIGLLKRRAKK